MRLLFIIQLFFSSLLFGHNTLKIHISRLDSSNIKILNKITYKEYSDIELYIDNNLEYSFIVKSNNNEYIDNRRYKTIFGFNDSTYASINISFIDNSLQFIDFETNVCKYTYNYGVNNLQLILKKANTINNHLPEEPMDTASIMRRVRRHQKDSDLTNNNTSTQRMLYTPITDCVVRVLVAYTQRAENEAITIGGINLHIQNLIDQTNISYTNSLVNAKVKLAKTMKVNYNDDIDIDDVLDNFQDTDDGKMDEIHLQRQLYHADICVLMTGATKDGSGVAETIGADELDESFCVVNVAGNFTFAHEIGHLYGAEHNYEDATIRPFNFRNYGYGWRFVGTDGLWYRTIMAYDFKLGNNNTVSARRINYWSNPNVSFNGRPTGLNLCSGCDLSMNNARVLNEQFPVLAGLYPFVPNVFVPFQTVSNSNIENLTGHTISSNNSYVIEPRSEVTFHAKNSIRITGNFHAKEGSFFIATTDNFNDCGNYNNTGRFEAIENTESIENSAKLKSFDSKITISPNPTSFKIKVTTGSKEESQIILTDLLGKQLQSFSNIVNTIDIDLSAYPDGLYLVKIINSSSSYIEKVILNKNK